MRAWQWSTCTTTLPSALALNISATLPSRPLKEGESLIKVHSASLNPVDYKLAELPIVGRFAIPKPATPGLDFSGVVVKTHPTSSLTSGQRVFGKLEPKQQVGTLGEYIIGSKEGTVPLPDGVSFEEGATLGNVQLCKDLGADEVIDYRTEDVTAVLEKSGKLFDMVLDNIGAPSELYWKAPTFTKLGAKYVQIGSQVSLAFIYDLAFRFLVPTALGGGQRPFSFGLTSTNLEDYQGLAEMVAKGQVKPVIDETFDFEQAREAYEKLRTGRAKGKIVVRVQSKS
ncbi:hypothetical protein N0V94_004348 [Neodidymelliopsis sp. IMI 364377]|nr:hypothetical protein N0V94_004348 [Neodidymelliopsis sp. IMI 364377]